MGARNSASLSRKWWEDRAPGQAGLGLQHLGRWRPRSRAGRRRVKAAGQDLGLPGLEATGRDFRHGLTLQTVATRRIGKPGAAPSLQGEPGVASRPPGSPGIPAGHGAVPAPRITADQGRTPVGSVGSDAGAEALGSVRGMSYQPAAGSLRRHAPYCRGAVAAGSSPHRCRWARVNFATTGRWRRRRAIMRVGVRPGHHALRPGWHNYGPPYGAPRSTPGRIPREDPLAGCVTSW
jgi:hypothetical protein